MTSVSPNSSDAGSSVRDIQWCTSTARRGPCGPAQNPIDLVLLDYRLPEDVHGLDFYGKMKETGIEVPVILVTGFSNETLAIEALRAGIRDFVTKSTQYLDYLPEAVGRVLRQVETERQLIDSETRLTSIIASAKDAIIIAEDNHRISLFNPAAEAMFRCSSTEAIGQPVSRFIPRRQPDALQAGFVAASTPLEETLSGWIRYGNRGIRADGTSLPVEISMSKGKAGPRKFYTIIVRDVTERVRAENRLAAGTGEAHADHVHRAGGSVFLPAAGQWEGQLSLFEPRHSKYFRGRTEGPGKGCLEHL